MTNRFNRWLAMWIILLVVPFWWLLMANDGGGGLPKPVHIADLRKLAGLIPGTRPTAVTGVALAKRLAVGDYFVGGIGLKRRPLVVVTWSLPVPGHTPIIIDPGMPPADQDLGQMSYVDHVDLQKIAAEARLARVVLYTQGSLLTPAHARTARWPYLLAGKAGMATLMSGAAALAAGQTSSYPTAQAVAPGVVIIPTSSHAPNTRLIFVALADGREFLFTGSVATLTENWSQLRIRSHLAAFAGAPQNSDETYAWLRTIRQLHSEAPHLQIVPAHDYAWLAKNLANGTVTDLQFYNRAL